MTGFSFLSEQINEFNQLIKSVDRFSTSCILTTSKINQSPLDSPPARQRIGTGWKGTGWGQIGFLWTLVAKTREFPDAD